MPTRANAGKRTSSINELMRSRRCFSTVLWLIDACSVSRSNYRCLKLGYEVESGNWQCGRRQRRGAHRQQGRCAKPKLRYEFTRTLASSNHEAPTLLYGGATVEWTNGDQLSKVDSQDLKLEIADNSRDQGITRESNPPAVVVRTGAELCRWRGAPHHDDTSWTGFVPGPTQGGALYSRHRYLSAQTAQVRLRLRLRLRLIATEGAATTISATTNPSDRHFIVCADHLQQRPAIALPWHAGRQPGLCHWTMTPAGHAGPKVWRN